MPRHPTTRGSGRASLLTTRPSISLSPQHSHPSDRATRSLQPCPPGAESLSEPIVPNTVTTDAGSGTREYHPRAARSAYLGPGTGRNMRPVATATRYCDDDYSPMPRNQEARLEIPSRIVHHLRWHYHRSRVRDLHREVQGKEHRSLAALPSIVVERVSFHAATPLAISLPLVPNQVSGRAVARPAKLTSSRRIHVECCSDNEPHDQTAGTPPEQH